MRDLYEIYVRDYRRMIVIIEGFLLTCPLLTSGRVIDKYRLAYFVDT